MISRAPSPSMSTTAGLENHPVLPTDRFIKNRGSATSVLPPTSAQVCS